MKSVFVIFSLFLAVFMVSIVTAIPNPAPIYCTEMGYTANDTSCIFNYNNSCELWAFYNGNCGQAFVKELPCAQFGQSLLPGHKCCEGLFSSTPIGATHLDTNGICSYLTGGWAICLKCGDGVCDSTTENYCSCPKDCPTPVTNATICTQKGSTCCKGELCTGGTCPVGSTYQFEKCDSNCMPIGSCSESNSTQTCTDSDNGLNYYVKGITTGLYWQDTINKWPQSYTDSCSYCDENMQNCKYVSEYYCRSDGKVDNQEFACPNGCQDGACLPYSNPCKSDSDCMEIACPYGGFVHEQCIQGKCQLLSSCNTKNITEQVKCVFKNSKDMQKCYLAVYNNKFFCSGVDACVMNVSGFNGEQLTWKSTCGGYAYTTIDGKNEYAEFSCPSTNQTPVCQSTQCEDGSYNTCYKDSNGYCTCSTCPPIVIKPVCGNGVCEAGEGMICSTTAALCEVGKECKSVEGKCFYGCEQDCKNLPGIYAKLNEKFKLQVSQTVKITDYKGMKITFRDLLTAACEATTTTSETVKATVAATGYTVSEPSTSAGGGGSAVSIIKCPDVGPMAQLEVVNPEEMGNKIVTLKTGEAKNIYDVSVSFLEYDFASRTGAFIVNSQTTTCPINCKCDSQGYVLECKNESSTCVEGTILCPDGVCRGICGNNSIENCDYGCLYNNKCLPVGVRVKGLYCTIDGTISNQLSSNEGCENNFECSSNLCVDGKCLSSSFIQKIISWFRRLFGG